MNPPISLGHAITRERLDRFHYFLLSLLLSGEGYERKNLKIGGIFKNTCFLDILRIFIKKKAVARSVGIIYRFILGNGLNDFREI